MKRMKKLFAVLLTMAMVMGLGITAFAADTVNIEVHNLEDGTTIKAVQVIEPDRTTETGWKFCEGMESAYTAQFPGLTAQNIIWSLIKYVDPDNEKIPAGITAAGATQITNALDAIPEEKFKEKSSTFSVSNAGVYAILATPKADSKTAYSRMAAYVGFTYTNGIATLPAGPVDVYAKKTEVPVVKTTTETDHATGITETVEYQVETAVPNKPETWVFTDEITGATYVTETQGENAGKIPVNVKVGNEATGTTYYAELGADGKSFTLNLKPLADTKENIGKSVTFTYKAVVTGTEVNNTIQYDADHKSDEVTLYTGEITFTKVDEKDTTLKLPGAGFKVRKGDKWAKFKQVGETSTYTLESWIDSKDNATEVKTDNNGTVIVQGLDEGIYYFDETTAPAGYSINGNPEPVELKLKTDAEGNKIPATEVFTATGQMKDTTLHALPSTGGMGTTLFTLGGCAVMICAAGLFFASRKKSN